MPPSRARIVHVQFIWTNYPDRYRAIFKQARGDAAAVPFPHGDETPAGFAK
jgi:hypothetical protein